MSLVGESLRLEEHLGCPPLIRLAGKRPLDRGWTTGPRNDPDGWRARLERHGGNVGMVCGGGLVVVDVDVHKPGAAASEAQLEVLGLPATLEARTGSGGRHLIYRADRPVASAPLRGFPGIDIKADGGQVVVAPSIHPVTGRAYEWINWLNPAPLPAWLNARCGKPSEVSTAVDIPAVGRPYRQNGWTVELAIF